MNKIHVLDTTLRDGGYCNDWTFGYTRIKKIAEGLNHAGIEIVECGFLTEKIVYERDKSKFSNLDEAAQVIQKKYSNTLYVCMINYGEFSIEHLPEHNEDYIDGIRVAFHKKDRVAAMEFCKAIKQKGYKVFIQPMVSLSYTDKEFLELIELTNTIQPYAFYIVDSFGTMRGKELIRLFGNVEKNLDENIWIGYHAHNNLQLAYSNAKLLAENVTNRSLIIDTSIFGMGRGAGNLNTELFVEYLNETRETNYKSIYLLRIIDEILMQFYNRNYWGFSIPYYISAINECHPNYASFLDGRKTLTVENMEYIMERIDEDKKSVFDEKYIQKLYMEFMTRDKVNVENDRIFEELVADKNILLVAPGKSILDEENKIRDCVEKNNPIIISINFSYDAFQTDFIFISNIRRFEELDARYLTKVISTSNIQSDDIYMKLNYESHIINDDFVKDNAGLMLIHYLIGKKVKKIFLAGFDGFSMDIDQNYIDDEMAQVNNKNILVQTNNGLKKMLGQYAQIIPMEFVTEPRFIKI